MPTARTIVTASTNSTADARKLERMVTRATDDMPANASGATGRRCSRDARPGFGRVVPRSRERPPDQSGPLVHGRPHEGNLRMTSPPRVSSPVARGSSMWTASGDDLARDGEAEAPVGDQVEDETAEACELRAVE